MASIISDGPGPIKNIPHVAHMVGSTWIGTRQHKNMTQALEQNGWLSEVDDHFFNRQLSHLQTTSFHDGYGHQVPELASAIAF